MRQLEDRSERLAGIAEMSASLAHEIRNPLASIRSAVEQLSRIPRASEDEQVLSTSFSANRTACRVCFQSFWTSRGRARQRSSRTSTCRR